MCWPYCSNACSHVARQPHVHCDNDERFNTQAPGAQAGRRAGRQAGRQAAAGTCVRAGVPIPESHKMHVNLLSTVRFHE